MENSINIEDCMLMLLHQVKSSIYYRDSRCQCLCTGIRLATSAYEKTASSNEDKQIWKDAEIRLKTWIDDLLDGNVFLEGWLRHVHGIDVFFGQRKEDMRQLRLKWVDWMIEFIEKGTK